NPLIELFINALLQIVCCQYKAVRICSRCVFKREQEDDLLTSLRMADHIIHCPDSLTIGQHTADVFFRTDTQRKEYPCCKRSYKDKPEKRFAPGKKMIKRYK